MSFSVGHNDVGFEPEHDPLQVVDLELARQILCNEITQWFSVVMQPSADGYEPEMTQRELSDLLVKVRALRPHSKLSIQGRVFWIQ